MHGGGSAECVGGGHAERSLSRRADGAGDATERPIATCKIGRCLVIGPTSPDFALAIWRKRPCASEIFFSVARVARSRVGTPEVASNRYVMLRRYAVLSAAVASCRRAAGTGGSSGIELTNHAILLRKVLIPGGNLGFRIQDRRRLKTNLSLNQAVYLPMLPTVCWRTALAADSEAGTLYIETLTIISSSGPLALAPVYSLGTRLQPR
jgi:hypothetical protein